MQVVNADAPLKRKTKAFVDVVLANPKMAVSDAYLQTHKTNNPRTAAVNGSVLMNQPNVLAYMAKHSDIAEQAIVSVLKNAKKRKNKDSIQWQRLVLDSGAEILDRVHGKALTRTNSLNVSMTMEEALNSLE